MITLLQDGELKLWIAREANRGIRVEAGPLCVAASRHSCKGRRNQVQPLVHVAREEVKD